MRDIQLFYLDLLEVGRQIRSRDRSSVEVTRAMLERIWIVDFELRSYVTVMADEALTQARRADEEIAVGRVRSPLHGVPLAIKDLLHTANAPTSHGMIVHKAFRAKEDATIVRRLYEAGAVVLGKLQMTEGAFAVHHPEVMSPVNPWGKSLWPGVSSSGSGVATAAGLCFASLGTDTGGSIRYPSAANGVTGLKPTWGRVSRHGAFALAASMDHIGPMARSAADAAAVLQVIAGADPLDPTANQTPVPDYLALMMRGFADLTVGVDEAWSLDRVDAPTKVALEGALNVVRQAGGNIREVKFPDNGQAAQDWRPLCAVETALEHEATFPSRREEYGPALAGLIDQGHRIYAMDHQTRTMRRADLRGRVNAMFADVDLLLAPITAHAGLSIQQMNQILADPEQLTEILRYTTPFDLTGHPSITLPAGRTTDGAPVGVQFVAPHFAEDLLVRAGWAYQQNTEWHRHHPAV